MLAARKEKRPVRPHTLPGRLNASQRTLHFVLLLLSQPRASLAARSRVPAASDSPLSSLFKLRVLFFCSVFPFGFLWGRILVALDENFPANSNPSKRFRGGRRWTCLPQLAPAGRKTSSPGARSLQWAPRTHHPSTGARQLLGCQSPHHPLSCAHTPPPETPRIRHRQNKDGRHSAASLISRKRRRRGCEQSLQKCEFFFFSFLFFYFDSALCMQGFIAELGREEQEAHFFFFFFLSVVFLTFRGTPSQDSLKGQ